MLARLTVTNSEWQKFTISLYGIGTSWKTVNNICSINQRFVLFLLKYIVPESYTMIIA